ncbi:protein ORANGE-LIKE, chloroplastic-like isoform X2 [Actinidia eriantha]|uniref:protein ORANGE-LIKE, chloroplastic-like isoform X2 n=1 Tax=Actinidia eriantha TaxID=165200 RepID=UPI00258F0537|nr:protein ORANGE-LIKE, chloroplastic-like isoform X2 [Actinidia eriantha]
MGILTCILDYMASEGKTPKTLKQLSLTSFSFRSGIIVFGGLLAPTLELKLGLGGTSYEDFICSMHLPQQLRSTLLWRPFQVGSGCYSALMLLEANNVEATREEKDTWHAPVVLQVVCV